MASLNKVLLIGNLTRDPELKHIQNGNSVADFGLAVNRRFKRQDGTQQDEVVFVDITCWGATADIVQRYLAKGRRVFVEGRLKLNQWTTQEGERRQKLTVVADSLQFLDAAQREDRPARQQDEEPSSPEPWPGDNDIPF